MRVLRYNAYKAAVSDASKKIKYFNRKKFEELKNDS